MPKVIRESEQMDQALKALFEASDSKDLLNALSLVDKALKDSKIEVEDFSMVLKEINPERFRLLQENARNTEKELEKLKQKQEAVNRAVNEFNPKHVASKIETITKTAAGFG
jgi:hypothetical protein